MEIQTENKSLIFLVVYEEKTRFRRGDEMKQDGGLAIVPQKFVPCTLSNVPIPRSFSASLVLDKHLGLLRKYLFILIDHDEKKVNHTVANTQIVLARSLLSPETFYPYNNKNDDLRFVGIVGKDNVDSTRRIFKGILNK